MWGFQNVYNFESPPKKNHITNLLFFIFKTQRHATHLVNSGFPVIDDFFYFSNCSSFKRKKSFTVINISLFKKLLEYGADIYSEKGFRKPIQWLERVNLPLEHPLAEIVMERQKEILNKELKDTTINNNKKNRL